ncbi:hypothetical protein MtrunA17_Chr2g0297421 [Medicago truncatula]|uniref:Uncharacterized protein n=1 Tax=Medicago truncatula TaxID=3880 RepID=A0A072V5V6_MEDTR|nr:hypothetical protein MTR_2g438310 [Medicago truncatula]RHN73343.1 hypothetical protein MtrunA17_Chr2g0297421 [Medicago truncatula]
MGKKKNVLENDTGYSGSPPAHTTNSGDNKENVLKIEGYSGPPPENTKPKDKINSISNQKGYSPPPPKKK